MTTELQKITGLINREKNALSVLIDRNRQDIISAQTKIIKLQSDVLSLRKDVNALKAKLP